MSIVSNNRETNSQPEAAAKSWEKLGDFTTTIRVLPISALALAIGVVAAFVALALLRLIGLFTNLFYFGRWSTALVSPAGRLRAETCRLPTVSPAYVSAAGRAMMTASE